MARITKAELDAMCEDIGATFAENEKGVVAMTNLIMQNLPGAEWLEKHQITIARTILDKWYATLEDFEKDQHRYAYVYVSGKLKDAFYTLPVRLKL